MNDFSGEARIRIEPTGRLEIPAVFAGEAALAVEPSMSRLRTPTEDIRNPQLRIAPNNARMVLR